MWVHTIVCVHIEIRFRYVILILKKGVGKMNSELSNKPSFTEEADMINYLMNEFCQDFYEREEMEKWLSQKSVSYVYNTVLTMFSND